MKAHNINCASLRRDGDNECSCHLLVPDMVKRSIDDASGQEWNEASAAVRKGQGIAALLAAHGHDEAPEVPPVDSEHLSVTLTRWWANQAMEEAEKTVPKAVEYGGSNRAADLTDLGRTMWGLMDQGGQGIEPTDGVLQELGIYFYICGKLGRWTAAIKEGRSVSDDTIFDIGVYIKMVQRIRETGGWPV